MRLGPGRILVVAQVALSVVMLVGAGLFVRTLRNLTHVDTGFSAEGVQLLRVHATASGTDLSRRLLESLQAIPGVRAAGVSAYQLLADSTDRTRVTVEGRAPSSAGDEFAHVNRVGGDFFTVMGIPIRAGRALGPQDDVGTPPTIVINEAFARAYFAGQTPLGRRVNGAEVVGVAADTRIGGVRDAPPPAMFIPAFQQRIGSFAFQLRTDAPPKSLPPLIRQAVGAVAPTAAVYDVTSVRQQVADSVEQEHLLAGLSSFFGALVLALASLGLYGLMAYSMGQRTREIGIRTALGARPAQILWMALASGLRLVVVGTALGVPTALLLTRLAAGLFYGVTPFDPLTIAAATLLLFGVTLLACWLPARRAERLDPAIALRHE